MLKKYVLKSNDEARKVLLNNYNGARIDLLVVVVLTVINIIFLLTKSYNYFLFSAVVPYELVNFGMYICGMHHEDLYEGLQGFTPCDSSLFAVFIAFAILILAVYLLCFFMSKKQRVGWLIAATAMFCVDAALMFVLWELSFDIIIDIIFHAIIIVTLINGIKSHFDAKKLPLEDDKTLETAQENNLITTGADEVALQYSPAIRLADTDVKSRTLASVEYQGMSIVYRRVKHTNELVINGHVYSEISGVIEHPHALGATYNGYNVEVGYDGLHSLIAVNGNILVKKIRLY